MKNGAVQKIRFYKKKISIKIPIICLIFIFGLLPMIIQSNIISETLRQTQTDNKMIEVQNQCLILSNKITRSGYMETDRQGQQDNMIALEISTIADVFNGRILIVDKNYRVLEDTFGLAENRFNVSEEVIRCFQGENISKYNKEKHYFYMTIPIYHNNDEKTIDGVMIATASTEEFYDVTDKIIEKDRYFQLTILWIVLLLAIAMINIIMRPFKKLQLKLNRIEEGNLDEELKTDSYKEINQISQSLDRTLTKIKAMDESRGEFVSNVSHELKTPITSIRVLADSLMGMEDAPVELYREFLSDISDEIDRESKIINDLLTLVRMDKSATEMNIEQINVNNLMELILKRLRPIAKKRNVEIVFESIREVVADVDEVKLSLALNNLVENAIKYNVEGGWVRVTLDADHKFFYVKVSDSGIGIPAEFQSHVFERFYRVDKARSRETGGTGLGLSITHNVIMMHQGAIKLQSKEGEGTTFTVRVPLNYIAPQSSKKGDAQT